MSDHIPERPPGIHESALREVAGGMLVGIILNQDGYVKYMNEAATTITGFSRDEVMQWKQYEFFDHIHPDDKAKVIEQFYKKQASAPDQARETIYRILTKGGQPRWIKTPRACGGGQSCRNRRCKRP